MSDLEERMRRRFLDLSLREIHDREAGRARANRILEALRGHLEYDGRDEDLHAWLTKHLESLVFDAKTRRWRILE